MNSRTGLLKFLYDKRLTLFNTRRQHEWKIYFGTFVLLGAMDSALIAGKLRLCGLELAGWVGVCLLVVLSCLGCERDLLVRVRADREAMDAIYNELCDVAGVPQCSPIRERQERLKPPRLGWAYHWQALLLFAGGAASAWLPLLLPKD